MSALLKSVPAGCEGFDGPNSHFDELPVTLLVLDRLTIGLLIKIEWELKECQDSVLNSAQREVTDMFHQALIELDLLLPVILSLSKDRLCHIEEVLICIPFIRHVLV